MEFKLYNGGVSLKFEERRHIYRVNGKPVPSVTGITGIVDKSGPLMGWAVNQCGEYLNQKLEPGKLIDEVDKVSLIDNMKREYRRASKKAADIGTLVHEWAEKYIKAEMGIGEKPKKPINKQVLSGVKAFLDWRESNDIEWIASEAKIYSRDYHYAGTIDLDAIVNGKRLMTDFKTSTGIYPEMYLQTAAYQWAREEELGFKYDGRLILRFPKDGSGLEEHPLDNFERDFNCFIAALNLYKGLKEIKAA